MLLESDAILLSSTLQRQASGVAGKLSNFGATTPVHGSLNQVAFFPQTRQLWTTIPPFLQAGVEQGCNLTPVSMVMLQIQADVCNLHA